MSKTERIRQALRFCHQHPARHPRQLVFRIHSWRQFAKVQREFTGCTTFKLFAYQSAVVATRNLTPGHVTDGVAALVSTYSCEIIMSGTAATIGLCPSV